MRDLPIPAERVEWSTGTDVVKVVSATSAVRECLRDRTPPVKGLVINIKSEAMFRTPFT